MNRPNRRTSTLVALSLVCAAAAAANGQPVERPPVYKPPTPFHERFTKVEQRIGDVDPLGVSSRQLPTDLRVPIGFRDVYRINGSAMHANRWGIVNQMGGDLFARMDGAVTAVFPQSVYTETREGVVPLIPAGTVFIIGALPFGPPPGDASPSPDRVDTQLNLRVHDANATGQQVHSLAQVREVSQQAGPRSPRTAEEPPASVAVPSIMNSEAVRSRTVRDLLMKAADAANQPAPAVPSPSVTPAATVPAANPALPTESAEEQAPPSAEEQTETKTAPEKSERS